MSALPPDRIGEAPSNALAASLATYDLPIGRLKTGMPARLDGRTIDWSGLDMQPADDPPILFHNDRSHYRAANFFVVSRTT